MKGVGGGEVVVVVVETYHSPNMPSICRKHTHIYMRTHSI